MVLKIVGIIVLLLIIVATGFFGYAWYRIKHVKDTHDLQAQADSMCTDFIQKKQAPGLCIGIIKGDVMYIKGFGDADTELKNVPDANTIFEIGSITKVFTAEMAQLLVDKGSLQWNDNILKYLPEEAKLPFDDSTTLFNLVTHTSGFPRLPFAILAKMANACDPYSTLTEEQFNDYLRHCTDKKKPDLKHYDYSNMSAALLARILEYRTGKDYETLLQELICGPLQMQSTSLYVKDSSRFATGYDEKGNKTCHWNIPVMYGCGAIRSDVGNMMRFLRAQMDEAAPLYPSFHKTHQQVEAIPAGIGYGWHIDHLSGVMSGVFGIVWHNGGTGGFRTYMGFVPEKKTGIIVMANQASDGVDRLGIDLLIKAATTSFKED